jgi:hypothetical protein
MEISTARVSYGDDRSDELLLELGNAVAHAILTNGTATMRVAAATRSAAEVALATIKASVPPLVGGALEVPARLWWWDADYTSHVARSVRVSSWQEITGNYAADTAQRLATLVAWSGPPASGGRLIICHGASGTGKTHAVQALAAAWHGWADLEVISDPEQFLANPAYLMSVASAQGDNASDRWRVAVLEDAGEHLSHGGSGRQVVGRLLNVGDGVLAQALRLLLVVTTNEPLECLDERLRRPGRLLAEIPFAPLTREETARWCEQRSLEPLDRERATIADLYSYAAGRELPATARPLGFAPADG